MFKAQHNSVQKMRPFTRELQRSLVFLFTAGVACASGDSAEQNGGGSLATLTAQETVDDPSDSITTSSGSATTGGAATQDQSSTVASTVSTGSTGSTGADDQSDTGEGKDATCQDLNWRIDDLLSTHCTRCHRPGGAGAASGLDNIEDLDAMIATGMVVPGEPESSPLYRRISEDTMPPAGVMPRPSRLQLDELSQWIDICAEGNMDCNNPHIGLPAILSSILDELLITDPDDRRFMRFISFAHLWNAGACRQKLDIQRFALSRVLNSLSRAPDLVRPKSIDPAQTIYRIDLRDYDWDADIWNEIVRANPFAIEYLEDDARLIQDFTRERVPLILGDWFIRDGSRPPLYYDVLRLPRQLETLERQLGINVAENIRAREVERAGFLESGVSEQNRVIERHQLPFGSGAVYWLSYDFAGDGGKDNIFSNPLDFVADGSEVIFSLPNGLHGYYIADAAGQRLNEAPDNIVVDPNQPDKNVVAGISCMGCHDAGINMQSDELRAFVLQSANFDAETKDLVEELHPPAAAWVDLIQRDQLRFQMAVAQLQPPAQLSGDGVNAVALAFDRNVDLTVAASELGILPQLLRSEIGRLNPDLAPLAYTSVKREVFEARFAETVCLLNLGLTKDPACRRRSRVSTLEAAGE